MATDPHAQTTEALTDRERDVLELLRAGLTDAQIAERLGISRPGASYHVSAIIGKLGVRNRYEAAAWPGRPPWWARAWWPLAALFGGRRLAQALNTASIVTAAVIVLAAAGGLGFLAFLLATTGGGDDGGLTDPSTIEVPYTVVENMTGYEFSTGLRISLPEQEWNVGFTGAFDAPDRYRGTFRISGTPFDDTFRQIGRPLVGEIVAIGQEVWWRDDGGDWHGPVVSEGEGFGDVFLLFVANAGPHVFIGGLRFDTLELETLGTERVAGAVAHHVRLNKGELIAMIDQGTFVKEEGKDVSIVREDAMGFLPDDTVIDVWLDERTLRPVRLVATLSADAGDETEGFRPILGDSFSIVLEIDITDPDAEEEIAPPPQATPVIP